MLNFETQAENVFVTIHAPSSRCALAPFFCVAKLGTGANAQRLIPRQVAGEYHQSVNGYKFSIHFLQSCFWGPTAYDGRYRNELGNESQIKDTTVARNRPRMAVGFLVAAVSRRSVKEPDRRKVILLIPSLVQLPKLAGVDAINPSLA